MLSVYLDLVTALNVPIGAHRTRTQNRRDQRGAEQCADQRDPRHGHGHAEIHTEAARVAYCSRDQNGRGRSQLRALPSATPAGRTDLV
jgi:hypothetical protein